MWLTVIQNGHLSLFPIVVELGEKQAFPHPTSGQLFTFRSPNLLPKNAAFNLKQKAWITRSGNLLLDVEIGSRLVGDWEDMVNLRGTFDTKPARRALKLVLSQADRLRTLRIHHLDRSAWHSTFEHLHALNAPRLVKLSLIADGGVNYRPSGMILERSNLPNLRCL